MRSREVAHRRNSVPRNDETHELAGNPATERKLFGLGSLTIVACPGTSAPSGVAIQIAAGQKPPQVCEIQRVVSIRKVLCRTLACISHPNPQPARGSAGK